MTRLEFRLLSLAKQARSIFARTGKVVPVFDGLPNWPAESVSPVWRITPSETSKLLQTSPFLRAIGLRQKHDPDEKSRWVFVPAGDGSEDVWMVLTKAFDPSVN
jgi:hypothetical protein